MIRLSNKKCAILKFFMFVILLKNNRKRKKCIELFAFECFIWRDAPVYMVNIFNNYFIPIKLNDIFLFPFFFGQVLFIFIEKEIICIVKILFFMLKKVQYLPFYIIKKKDKMTTLSNEKRTSAQLVLVSFITSFQKSEEEKIQVIIQYWIRILKIKLRWIYEFYKIVVNYAPIVFMFDTFRLSSKLINTFTRHTNAVLSIDYSTFTDYQLICSGSHDKTVYGMLITTNKFNHSIERMRLWIDCDYQEKQIREIKVFVHINYILESITMTKQSVFFLFQHQINFQIQYVAKKTERLK
ncbi:hypothetical protein RFI_25112 [Reticulomyxa filosa]|uniref:Uncharacterized protein n=1 Tax=Reticulomyxa filosa TaxID=46433 RepID=X6MGU1_RETFI|nr:hypothetical protein RFI_25112 [Reticulomyxa filosa]|eukprot:ETO12265.1 hypothetical protein RFI_25112 [Reticulomyxa filosa]